MRDSAQQTAKRNQQLNKELAEQKSAVKDQKQQVAAGETERKRLEGLVAEANADKEELDRLRSAASGHPAELAAVEVRPLRKGGALLRTRACIVSVISLPADPHSRRQLCCLS